MKFKRLPAKELQKLEPEFVQFLVANGIIAGDWQKMKSANPEKAEALIDIFSDIVYQRTMEHVNYLEYRTANDIKCFKCGKETIELRGLEGGAALELDLRKAEDLKKLATLNNEQAALIHVYSGSKAYVPGREEEIFRMMEAGAVKTDHVMYDLIDHLYRNMKA